MTRREGPPSSASTAMLSNPPSFANLGFGLGLRTPHFETILNDRPKDLDWLEIISDNFIDAHDGYREMLEDVRRDYPIVMHGVSLSIGSTDPLNKAYLAKLKNLAALLDAPLVSDHLCWTGMNGRNTHDLLPVAYTKESLDHIVDRLKEVQDILGRPVALENPSTYLEFDASIIPEWEFIATMADRSGCALLLDVNNVYVNAFNHGYDPKHYIDVLPKDRIAQIHLAGHKNFGTHIIDTHDATVLKEVWDLYRYTVAAKGSYSTMVEWDEHIPSFEVLMAELAEARRQTGIALQKDAA